jgi:effector-binding domain-containing protein
MPTDLRHAPEIIDRDTESYVGVRRTVTMDTFHELADRISELFDWLAARDIEPAGAPFFRLNVIDMARELQCEAGVPIVGEAPDDPPHFIGVLPAGRYVSYTHTGHVDELVDVTTGVLAWADDHGLTWDMTGSPAGDRWGCRLIVNLTDPDDEPDMSKWHTTLLFRLAD